MSIDRRLSACLAAIPAAAALTLAGTVGAQFDAENVTLLSHLDLADFGSDFAEDCWGYVAPSGREYAIIGLSQGTGFVEITDPANPVIVDIIGTANQGRDMKVFDHYVFSSSGSGPLHLIDVGDIDNGNVTLLSSFPEWGTHNVVVDEVSGFLYLAVGGPLVAIDISDPENPVEAGRWNGETHDAQVVTYSEGVYAGRQIAFVSSGRTETLDIVDVTDKANMFLLGQAAYSDAAYTHQGWLTGDRRHFYVNDELDDIPRTTIFDVSDLENPFHVSDFTTGLQSTDHNLYVRGGFIFEANYTTGLRVFDACDPKAPVEVGFFDTYPPDNDPGFIGAWSNFPFFPSGAVIVSDRSGGLFVLDVSDAVGKGCPDCPEDIDGSGAVDFADILAILSAWGPCDGCPEDISGNGVVDFADILAVLSAWGPCP